MVNLFIAYKDRMDVTDEQFESMEEAVAYLMGRAVTGDVSNAIEISITTEKGSQDHVRSS
tara:strand:- start:596 stop:775 length:180 start_codon:yes stop_codon:yes gene_type:complete